MYRPLMAPYSRVVLPSDGWVTQLRNLLPYITQDVMPAYHEMMYHIVEAVRYRDKAIGNIVQMVKALETNLDNTLTIKRQFMYVVKQIALHLYFQIEELGLYGDIDCGVLMFTYCRHPDDAFDDVLLSEIIPLTYNGSYYEPPT